MVKQKIAGDVVLLPSTEVMEACVQLNQELLKSGESRIVLNTTDCVPHISLAMGCLKEEDLPAVECLLTEIASAVPPLRFPVSGLGVGRASTGESLSSLVIEPTGQLQSLHETIMKRIAPYMTYDATPEMFVDPRGTRASSAQWVNNYARAASFEHFFPHITIGIGDLEASVSLPTHCPTSRLALCHLGHDCTCRRVLFEAVLRG
jgi:2'-5' RNA ligase